MGDNADMAKVIALAVTVPRAHQALDLLRGLVVCGCALALILAGQPLPSGL